MPLHGPTSNKQYVQRVAPFMRAESRLTLSKNGRNWYIYDTRSGKLWAGPHPTQAKAWRSLADSIRKNGGSLANHAGEAPYKVVTSCSR